MNTPEEKVLVVPTNVLREAGLFHGFSSRVEHYLPHLLDPRHMSYLPRSRAEEDPEYKQIIPYVILKHGALMQAARHYAGQESSLELALTAHVLPVLGLDLLTRVREIEETDR